MAMEKLVLFALSVFVVLVALMLVLMIKRIRERSVHELVPVQTPVELLQHSHWYEKPFLLFLAILLVCPVGIYGLYKHFLSSRRRRLQMIY